MLRKLAMVTIIIVTGACKMLPGHMRSGSSSAKVGDLMDPESIQFIRGGDGRSGLLSFSMKDQHECRVEYWADDPNGTPPPSSPMTVDCPKAQLTLQPKISIPGLTPGVTVTFKVYVWPKTLNFLASYSTIFHEGRDLNVIKSSNLVVVRYSVPRNSDEIYTYQFPGTMSLANIKAALNKLPASPCEENPKDEELPFPRTKSGEDPQKRPLHGLSQVSSSGFGNAAANAHPFFPTRLVQFFDATSKQESWKWNFQWEGKAFSFESTAPGSMASLTLNDAGTILRNRSLSNALPDYTVDGKSPVFGPQSLFATDSSRYILTVKSEDGAQTILRCQFPVDQATVKIPDELYAKLSAGDYVLSFSLETNQVHFREQGDYPPWIITAQDFVHFKLNKRL